MERIQYAGRTNQWVKVGEAGRGVHWGVMGNTDGVGQALF